MSKRVFCALFFLSCLGCHGATFAQAPLGGAQEGNLGTWKWGKQPPAPPSEEPEETDDDTDQERGKTSWERMNAEREPEQEPQEEKTVTPLELWRTLREKFK